ncbi:Sds3-like-domain-containing protein [Myxozyma melibiosi]|uniref:Sds3-like-domain-containing protein n=1 Tax=Myxozyma melibiosi TaxID=54550 RepID=A0ABR1F6F7_9ASCO
MSDTPPNAATSAPSPSQQQQQQQQESTWTAGSSIVEPVVDGAAEVADENPEEAETEIEGENNKSERTPLDGLDLAGAAGTGGEDGAERSGVAAVAATSVGASADAEAAAIESMMFLGHDETAADEAVAADEKEEGEIDSSDDLSAPPTLDGSLKDDDDEDDEDEDEEDEDDEDEDEEEEEEGEVAGGAEEEDEEEEGSEEAEEVVKKAEEIKANAAKVSSLKTLSTKLSMPAGEEEEDEEEEGEEMEEDEEDEEDDEAKMDVDKDPVVDQSTESAKVDTPKQKLTEADEEEGEDKQDKEEPADEELIDESADAEAPAEEEIDEAVDAADGEDEEAAEVTEAAEAEAEAEDGELEEEEEEVEATPTKKRKVEDDEDNEERARKRRAAVASLTEIEVEFAKLRDRLHEDRILRLNAEIEMCLQGRHPELAAVYEQIARTRDERIRLAEAHRRYRRRCIENQTRSYRSHWHQQFFKNVANLRAKMMSETTETWYRINRERRAMDALVPFYGYRIPEKRSTQVRQRQAQYQEVAILTGLAKYVGFPAAPDINSASADEIAEDLEALRGPKFVPM